jgi:hypothetical protein
MARISLLLSCVLTVLLSGCHPFGCDSSRCVDEHIYTDARRCHAILNASLMIVSRTGLPNGSNYDRNGIDSILAGGMNNKLATGARLGMSRDTVYKDLEQATNAYLVAYEKRTSRIPRQNPEQKLRPLFDDINSCFKPAGAND